MNLIAFYCTTLRYKYDLYNRISRAREKIDSLQISPAAVPERSHGAQHDAPRTRNRNRRLHFAKQIGKRGFGGSGVFSTGVVFRAAISSRRRAARRRGFLGRGSTRRAASPRGGPA